MHPRPSRPVQELIVEDAHNKRVRRTAIKMLLIDNLRVMQLCPTPEA